MVNIPEMNGKMLLKENKILKEIKISKSSDWWFAYFLHSGQIP